MITFDRYGTTGAHGQRVLIVDDNDNVRRVLAGILRAAGHAVVQAGTGSEAIAWIKRASIDLLVIDLDLPGFCGWDVVEQARAAWPQVRVVAIGNGGRRPTVAADARLPKPYSLNAFKQAIDRALRPANVPA